MSDIEILVADNASDDNTQEILASYTDKRLVFWRNENNIGIEKNILNLLKFAKGDWLFFLTDDDYLLPDAVGQLLVIVQSDSTIGVVLSSVEVVDLEENLLWIYHFHKESRKFSPGLDALVNMVGAAHVLSRILVRRDWIDVSGVERTLGSMYPQMYIVGSVLREHAGYYLDLPTVAHTTGNETAWDYPSDFMVGPRITMLKDMLPSPSWKRERKALINQLIDEIRSSHMPLSWQKSLFSFFNHQRVLLHCPEVAFSVRYWKNLLLFLIAPNPQKVMSNIKNKVKNFFVLFKWV